MQTSLPVICSMSWWSERRQTGWRSHQSDTSYRVF